MTRSVLYWRAASFAVAAGFVGGEDSNGGIGQIGIGGIADNRALQDRLQRERSGCDGKWVAH